MTVLAHDEHRYPASMETKMPYVVTAYRPTPFGRAPFSSRAVATLEEAKAEVAGFIDTQPGDIEDAFFASALIPESGGSITLPDGTVIEVAADQRDYLLGVLYGANHPGRYVPDEELCDAFNAREQADAV